MVEIPVSFEMYPEVKTSADSLPFRSSSSYSSSTSGLLVPALLRVAHAQVIVGAPDDDFARDVGRMPDGMGKASRNALEVGKHPVATLPSQTVERFGEERVIVHRNFGLPVAPGIDPPAF